MISRDRIFKLNIRMYLRNEKMKNNKIKKQLQQKLLKLKQSDTKITVTELIFSRKRKQLVFDTDSSFSLSFSTSDSRSTVSIKSISVFVKFKTSTKRRKEIIIAVEVITKNSREIKNVDQQQSAIKKITKLSRFAAISEFTSATSHEAMQIVTRKIIYSIESSNKKLRTRYAQRLMKYRRTL